MPIMTLNWVALIVLKDFLKYKNDISLHRSQINDASSNSILMMSNYFCPNWLTKAVFYW